MAVLYGEGANKQARRLDTTETEGSFTIRASVDGYDKETLRRWFAPQST